MSGSGTFNQRITVDSNDGYKEGGSSWSYTGNSNIAGKSSSGNDYTFAVRFTGLDIDNGCQIDSATLTITANDTNSDALRTKVYGFDEDDTADLSTDPSSRTKTTASVDFDRDSVSWSTEYTINVASIIQEIVDRPGWTAGNDIGFIVVNDGSATDNNVFFFAKDNGSANNKEPELDVAWSTPSSPSASQSPSPSLSPSASQSPSSSPSPSPSTSISPSPSPGDSFGIKIAKEGKNIYSTSIDDYVFWSKHPTLILLEKKEATITVTSGACSGTYNFLHDYGFMPLVIGAVTESGGNRYLMPSEDFASISCSVGDIPNTSFTYKVKVDKVEITYLAQCIEPMVGTTCPLADASFDIELYFYMWELGSKWPL